MKTVTAAIAIMAVFALCLVPLQGVDADYADIDGETNVIGVGADADFQVIYTNNDYSSTDYPNLSMAISYEARLVDGSGDTVSNGVSPSSGDLDNGTAQTLTVSAPDTAGRYTLVVDITVDATYTSTDEEGNETTQDLEVESRTLEYPITVVEPITLSVTLSNNSDEPLQGYGVYFYVDGERIDDSFTTVDLDANGTTTIEYEWITDAGYGTHEFHVEAADGGNMVDITGLGERHTFYIGDNDYTWVIVLLVVVIVLLVLVMIWVYRKPVKNYGKPKSRR